MADRVRAVIDAGVAGINIEDGIQHETLRSIDDAASRIAAARRAASDAGVPIVINARVDTWIVHPRTPTAQHIEEALRRAQAYLEAGADCIYPIALADPEVIAVLCTEIPAPVNIGARAGMPDLAALGRLGVARVSTATRLATLALAHVHRAAQTLLRSGSFEALDAAMNYDALQQMFSSIAPIDPEIR